MGTKSASDIHSMTGFGRGSAVGQKYRATVEVRAVNGRFLEIRCKLARPVAFLETMVREMVEKRLNRGAIDVAFTIQPVAAAASARFDQDLARSYAEKAEVLAKELDLSSGLSALALLKLPGVMDGDEGESLDEEAEVPKLAKAALEEALTALLSMRKKEGDKLAAVLQRELAEISSHREWIFKHRQEINDRYARRLLVRIEEWSGKTQAPVDQGRLYQEVAYYLDRSDVTEELDRLSSHLKQFEDAFRLGAGNKSLGKRLEFLAQELGREVNTIGSKSDQVQVIHHVVEMKLTLEKIREQVLNLE